jgi:hypothetical protein
MASDYPFGIYKHFLICYPVNIWCIISELLDQEEGEIETEESKERSDYAAGL